MLTTYGANKLGDHLIGKTSYTMVTPIYMGLLASNPTVAGLLTSELVFTGYARKSITGSFSAFAAKLTTNSAVINYGIPGTSDSPAAYVALMDALTAGNMIAYEMLTTPRAVIANGRTLQFYVGEVTIRMI